MVTIDPWVDFGESGFILGELRKTDAPGNRIDHNEM